MVASPSVRKGSRRRSGRLWRPGQRKRSIADVQRGLRYFHSLTGRAPAWRAQYLELTKSLAIDFNRRDGRRRIPSSRAVLSYYPSLADAWRALGLEPDFSRLLGPGLGLYHPWKPLEDWYLREATGRLKVDEIARDLGRCYSDVRKRATSLGLQSRSRLFSLAATARASGLAQSTGYQRLVVALKRGALRCEQFVRDRRVDPVDVLTSGIFEWERMSPEYLSLVEQLAHKRIVDALESALESKGKVV